MKININELPDHLNEKDMAEFEGLFDDIEKDAAISDEQQQRILSSVMRKAGNGMDTIITNKRNTNETATEKTIETNRKIHIKRGGAIAACIAVLAAGGVMFSLNNNIHQTVPNTDRDSSVFTETVCTDSEDTQNDSENVPDAKTENDSVIANLYEKYLSAIYSYGFEKINNERYLIHIPACENDSKNNKYIIYDVSSGSEITAITTDMVLPEVFANKFDVYKYDSTKNILQAAVYDESGNALHEYEVETDIEEGYHPAFVHPVFNDDGSRMFFVMEKDLGDFHTDSAIYYVDSGDNTPHLLNKDSLKNESVSRLSVSGDTMLVECHDVVGLISTDPDCKENATAFDLQKTYYYCWLMSDPWINGYLGISYSGDITIIAPDDDGDIQVGNNRYTIKNYELGDDQYNTNRVLSCSGRYLVVSYKKDINDFDDTMYYTLYEIGKDDLTKIKTVKKEIDGTEYDENGKVYFDESTGLLTTCREKNIPLEEYDEVRIMEDGSYVATFEGPNEFTFDVINLFK